jgi:hypothetical protein
MTFPMAIHFFLVFIDTVSLFNKITIDMVVHNKKRLLEGNQQNEER